MTPATVAAYLAFILAVLLVAADKGEVEVLKQRIAVLERRTAPIEKVCSQDDFYEAFFRLVQEQCEKGDK